MLACFPLPDVQATRWASAGDLCTLLVSPQFATPSAPFTLPGLIALPLTTLGALLLPALATLLLLCATSRTSTVVINAVLVIVVVLVALNVVRDNVLEEQFLAQHFCRRCQRSGPRSALQSGFLRQQEREGETHEAEAAARLSALTPTKSPIT